MKRLVYIVLFIAVAAVLLNDGGRLFTARSTLNAGTDTLSTWASGSSKGLIGNQVAGELAKRGTALGIDVYQYALVENGVQIWTQIQVEGLWVWGTYKSMLVGVPFREAMGAPVTLRQYSYAEHW